MIRRDEALSYHGGKHPGKIALRGMKPCLTARDMRLAYIPGATFACAEIARDAEAAARYTARGHLVAVVTNGSAVPGLGNVGPLAAKPMQEGMALLFKRLADIDVFDLEIDAAEPDRFVEVVQRLEPTFGAIVIKDVRAPEGLAIYDRLRDTLNIPVFHENLHSTAVVAMAALSNALDLADKDIADVRVVICGAGTVGLGCARLAIRMGVDPDSLLMYDVHGLLRPERDDLNPYQREFAHATRRRRPWTRDCAAPTSSSAPPPEPCSRRTPIRAMARFPIVFPLATPEPEIAYDAARAARRDAIVATGLAQYPNAIVDLLSAPFVLRGALDVEATRITEGMLLAAAGALAGLAREEVPAEVSRAYGHETLSFGPEYLLPKPIDQRILVREPAAVAARALADGVARQPVDAERYQESLRVSIGTGRETLRRMTMKARNECPRVVFPDGTHETVLRACSMLADEGVARPVLLGHEAEVRAAIEQLGLDSAGVSVVDPVAQHQPRALRRGVLRDAAAARRDAPDGRRAPAQARLLRRHDAAQRRRRHDGVGHRLALRRLAARDPRGGRHRTGRAAHLQPLHGAAAQRRVLPGRLRRQHRSRRRGARRDRAADGAPRADARHRAAGGPALVLQLRQREPPVRREGAAGDGDREGARRRSSWSTGRCSWPPPSATTSARTHFPFSTLKDRANVLVFPDLQSGNTAMHLLQHVGDAVVVGPVLMGTRLPVHLIQYGHSAEDVVHLTATGIVEAVGLRQAAGPPLGWATSST